MSLLNKLLRRKLSADVTTLTLVIDIGSASVAGALVLHTNEEPRILYTVRKPMILQRELNIDRFLHSMLNTLEIVVRSIEKKGLSHLNLHKLAGKPIVHTLIMYASPWYTARTHILTVEQKEPFTVTRSLIEDLIQNEEKDSFKNNSGSIIERAVTSTKLNGYRVDHVEDRNTRQLQLTVSNTILSNDIAPNVEDILNKTFKSKKYTHHSFPLAAFTAIRDIFHELNDFLLLDISGEVSDLSFIKDGSLLETISFPKGKHFILRHIADSLNLSMDEAYSVLRMHVEGKNDTESSKKIERILDDIKHVWSNNFRQVLKTMRHDIQLPGRLFYMADKDFVSILNDALKMSDVDEIFEHERIGYTTLKNHVEFVDTKTYDPFISVGAFFLNRML